MNQSDFEEVERLCALHDTASCDYSHCERFYKELAQFLDVMEDAKQWKVADVVMEALVNCVPNPSGTCKTADRVKATMRKLHALASKMAA
ncbi:MAG: hypothetical protein C0609_07740 [Deltaproteobacteria bacterium]|nr:MAG: hypothetical protein C0609_07740 [Deltaproteobacteria bacterium]